MTRPMAFDRSRGVCGFAETLCERKSAPPAAPAQHYSEQAGRCDWHKKRYARRNDRKRHANPVRGKRSLHCKDRLRNHSHGYQLKAMHQLLSQASVEHRVTVSESQHQKSRGQCKPYPCRQSAGPTGSQNADRKPHLTARWTGQGLCKRDELSRPCLAKTHL
jgi:hypothetical protein